MSPIINVKAVHLHFEKGSVTMFSHYVLYFKISLSLFLCFIKEMYFMNFISVINWQISIEYNLKYKGYLLNIIY